jgi:hypothetical protein
MTENNGNENNTASARPRSGAPLGNGNGRTHGLKSLKKAWSKLGNRMLDGRSQASVALRKWRAEIVEDLGGSDNMSAQKETIVDLACRSRLILHSVDTWLFEQESLVYRSKKRLATVLPVVMQRQQLADSLAQYMKMLGLERRHKVKTLNEILQHDGPPKESE